MINRKATSVEVVTAFCKRAAISQQCVNCLTEIFFEEAIARARECDGYLEKNGRPMGPLHGLPISLKVRSCLIISIGLLVYLAILILLGTGFFQRQRHTNDHWLHLLPIKTTSYFELESCELIV